MSGRSCARRSSSASERAMKLGFSTKSLGGYPHSASSGKTTRSAPRSRAHRANLRILSTLPLKSPTVVLVWARAIFINKSHQHSASAEEHELPRLLKADG